MSLFGLKFSNPKRNPENKKTIDFIPNVLKSGPAFILAKRYSFDQMQSQFQHITGLMANKAKINILGTIASPVSLS